MNFNDLFAASGRSAFNKDSAIGETVSGPIISADQRQMTDYVTKTPETWDNGDPKMQAVITIKTDQTVDEHDDGNRSIYIKTWGLDKNALIQAVRDAGFTDVNSALATGNIFTATFTGTQPSKYGSDQKIYSYQIQRAPKMDALQTPTPTTGAAPTTAPTPAASEGGTDIPALIKAGLTDQQIAEISNADPQIIAMVRAGLGTN